MKTFKRFKFSITQTGTSFVLGASIRGNTRKEAEKGLEQDFPPHEGYVIHYVSSQTYSGK